MAETRTAATEAEESGMRRKTLVLVGVDDSDHSNLALEWAVRHVAATPGAELVVIHGKPSASSVVTFGSPGAGQAGAMLHFEKKTWSLSSSEFPAAAGDVVRFVEADLRKRAEDVVDRARSLCIANSVHALIEVIEGEPRYVLCNAVEKHGADLLVVGSHGYGAIKRAFLGSVSDYCTHHTHCSVVIVKQPKPKIQCPHRWC